MKIKFFLLYCFLAVGSCITASTAFADLEWYDENTFIDADKQDVEPLTQPAMPRKNGKLVKYFPDGTIQSSVILKDGLKQGDAKHYWPNGEIRKILRFKDDQLDGHVIEYDMQGNLVSKKTYSNGQMNGESITYYPEGGIKIKHMLLNGKYDGISFSYYPDGNVWEEVNFEQGVQQGQTKIYDESGQLNRVKEYDDGHCQYIIHYQPDGSQKKEECGSTEY